MSTLMDGIRPIGLGEDDSYYSVHDDEDSHPIEDNEGGEGNTLEDQEEEERDGEEEDDEEEEEETHGGRSRKRAKHRHRRGDVSRFVDIEAEVSDDDDEGTEEEEDTGGFIDTVERDDDDSNRRHHALLDAQRHAEDTRSPEQIEQALRQRYSGRSAVKYTGDMNQIPQRLLMPSVHDASLWQVRVKPGRERDIVFSLMRKAMDLEYSARPLAILSAFQRDSLPGLVYVEARSAQQVSQACNGLVGVYPSRGIQLVPIEEMASLLLIKKQEVNITPGTWVRIRRGKYQGDLAKVVDVTDNGEDVGLTFVPRIDMNPRDDASLDAALGRKRKKNSTASGTTRPPQRLFNPEEIVRVYGKSSVTKRNQVYVFAGETFRDGFMEKDFKLSGLVLEDVNPTLDEITQFSGGAGNGGDHGLSGTNNIDLSVIAEASRKAAIAVLQPGDHIEVFEGEQAGMHGVVEEVSKDVVSIMATGVDVDGQKVDVPARSVRKRFKPGDHVKVMAGKNVDETGLVVSVADNIVTFLSDMSLQEVSVFSKDLREAAEVGASTNVVGSYELHDLVQLDQQTVGVIFKTERDSFRVLDHNGQVRVVQPHQISMRRDSNRAIATDSEGFEIRVQDNMKETDGEGRKGVVLHIHQSVFAFLYNRDLSENGGVFVTRARGLVSVTPRGNKLAGMDLSKMNPDMAMPIANLASPGGEMSRGRDRSIGMPITIIKGNYKGYVGTIKDVSGTLARVELSTGNKIINIDKSKLKPRDDALFKVPQARDFGGATGSRAPNPYINGGRTPGWNATRTPNPYADSRTPAWNASSRTPNPYAGSHTPAWNASSRTPNPYAADGGRTPAWNAGSRTPNPYMGGAATPARPSWGGEDSWGAWSAPTPAAVPTPITAPTPGPTTPYAIYTPMPYQSGPSAPTPAAGGGFAPETLADRTNEGDAYNDTPEDWFLDGAFEREQKRLVIKIEGTRISGYLDGQYEGRIGRITAASRVKEGFDQTAYVEFDDSSMPMPGRTILAKYIVPVEPGLEDTAIILRGRYKGMTVKVRATDGIYTVSPLDSTVEFVEVPKEDLVKLWPL